MLVYIWKGKWSKEVERPGQKNIQNKAVQTKLNLYIKKYKKRKKEKGKHYKYSKIVCWYSVVCVQLKRLNIESVL